MMEAESAEHYSLGLNRVAVLVHSEGSQLPAVGSDGVHAAGCFGQKGSFLPPLSRVSSILQSCPALKMDFVNSSSLVVQTVKNPPAVWETGG